MSEAAPPAPSRPGLFARLRGKDAGFYAYFVTRVIAGIAGFFVLRFLVAFMSRPQYGEWGFLNTVGEMLVPIASLSLPAAMMRMYFDRAEDDTVGQARLVSTVFLLMLGAVGVVLLGALSLWLVTGETTMPLFFVCLTTATLMTGFFNYLARVRNDYVVFAMSRIAGSAGLVGAMALVVTLAEGALAPHFAPEQRLTSTIFIYATVMWLVVVANGVFYSREGMLSARIERMPWAEIKELVKFSAPLSGTFFLGWTLASSDVWLLKQLSTMTEVADYVLAVGIAHFVSLVTSAALTDWPRFFYAEMRDDQPGRDERIAKRVRLFLGLHIGAIAIIRLVARFAYDILGAQDYSAGVGYIGLLALGNFFFLSGNIAAAGIGLAKKTYLTIVTFTVPAVLNIGLNIWLLPRYGAYAAAATTALAFVAFAGASFVVGRPLYRFQQVPTLLAIAACACAVALVPF